MLSVAKTPVSQHHGHLFHHHCRSRVAQIPDIGDPEASSSGTITSSVAWFIVFARLDSFLGCRSWPRESYMSTQFYKMYETINAP